jgi:hypothetical protein
MKSALYSLGLAFLFAHELDAVTHSEWRLLFGLRSLPDTTALPAFVSLHVPLFFGILWFSYHQRDRVRELSRLLVAGFLVLHAGLHVLNSSAPNYEFQGVLSNVLIASAGVCGAAYVAAWWKRSRQL